MKVLYAIQGTGNGHISRALEIAPLLLKKADTDILISGCQTEMQFPNDVKYRLKGLGFIFGKRGGIDFWSTYRKSDIAQFKKDIGALPVEKYDVVINDFEPVSAWAARKKGVPCIALSHQSAVLQPYSPQPKNVDPLGINILRHYAPTDRQIGFHFQSYNSNIYTPVVRREIRNLKISNDGHYLVYLPSYNDEKIIAALSQLPDVNWHVFSTHSHHAYQTGNISIFPINNERFIDSLARCEGVLCGAGFETPAESLFLGKKLMVIPMKNQYEQACNAASLGEMGVPILKDLKTKKLHEINSWLNSTIKIKVNYPDQTELIIDKILADNLTNNYQRNLRDIMERY